MPEIRFSNNELSIVKNNIAFNGYARSYKIEFVDRKDPIV